MNSENVEDVIDGKLSKLTRLLQEGRNFEVAFLAALYLKERAEGRDVPLGKANFDPNQPRDERGWWTDEGVGPDTPSIIDVQYRGRFHDLVVDDLLKGLADTGSQVLKNVSVLGLNGLVAIPDGATKPKDWKIGYLIEVKTGGDPPFTKNQEHVYPLICAGGHATSFDPRVRQLGLSPGVPFPPLKIMLVYTRGPMQPLAIIDYCKEIGLGD